MGRVYVIHDVCRKTVDSTPTYVNGAVSEWRRCTEHGVQQLVPMYVFKTDPITKVRMDLLFWGCPECFRKAYGDPKEDMTECCYECKETNNLADCPMCGNSTCKNHQIDGVCLDCIDAGKIGFQA